MKQSETNLGEKGEKGETKYYCNICDYSTCIKFSFDRHLMTSKHQILTNPNKKMPKNAIFLSVKVVTLNAVKNLTIKNTLRPSSIKD